MTGRFGASDRGDGTLERALLGQRTPDVPLARLQELDRHVERLGLDVFGQGDRHGTGLGRVGQHAHGGERDREELLGAVDTVEVARQRPEGVGDLDAGVVRHARSAGAPDRRRGSRRCRSAAAGRAGGSSWRARRRSACWRHPVRPTRSPRRSPGDGACGRSRPPGAPSPARCAPGGTASGRARSSWICLSAWPTPATLPCPKMPKMPGMVRSRTSPSTVHWLARNSTRAWPTVIRLRRSGWCVIDCCLSGFCV